LLAVVGPAASEEFGLLPPDKPSMIGTVEAVCTGVGLDARENPLWAGYPLKVEVAGRGGQYLGEVQLTVTQAGQTIASLRCGGPWILLRLTAGRYAVEAQTEGHKVSSSALVPANGQSRVILRFPDLGGETAPPDSTRPQ